MITGNQHTSGQAQQGSTLVTVEGALGPVTNLASRLSTKAAAGQILIGRRLFAAVEKKVETVAAGNLELKGFARPVAAYEVRGLR